MARQLTEPEFLARVYKWIPAGIPREAIESVECDPWDGSNGMWSYWVYLNDGYVFPDMECHTAHEDTLREIREQVESIALWPEDPALVLHNGYTKY